jgi:anti-sigma factor (TIGR02949 family)
VSRAGSPREWSERTSGPGDSGCGKLVCASVTSQVWPFLDGECTPEAYSWLCRHLATCENCLDHYALEARIKNLIATRCGGDEAPRWRWGR